MGQIRSQAYKICYTQVPGPLEVYLPATLDPFAQGQLAHS